MKILIADIEADALLPDLSKCHCFGVKEFGKNEVDPRRTIYADHAGYRPISEALERLSDADVIVMHNGIGYDAPAIVQLYGSDAIRGYKIYDTLVASRFKNPTQRAHSLGYLGEQLGFEKGDFSDFTKFTDEMADYCHRDLEVTEKVFEQLWTGEISDALALEFRFARVMALQEQHGFRLDVTKAQALESELRQEQLDIERSLQSVWLPKTIERVSEKTGRKLKDKIEVFNPSSRKQIGERLTEQYGWKPKDYTPSGQPKIDETVLDRLKYDEAAQLSRYLRLQKLLGQLSDGNAGWLKLERDGYVHGSVKTIGTATHRCSHFGPNMGQVDRRDLRMREVWLPDPGQVLVGCDADALELVCLAHYLGRYDDGEYQDALLNGSKDDGTDVHSRTQKLLELPTRDHAKTAQYAYLYGASDRKLAQISREAGGPVKSGKEIRRRMNEGINGLGKLSAAIQRRADVGWFKAIDGRRIDIKSPHSALNYLLQSTGAIVMKKAVDVFHYDLATKAGFVRDENTVNYSYVANVHDEVQLSADPDYADQLGQMFADAIRLAAERLKMRCPLSGTYAIGSNWKDTH